jgi:hypothetical protein
MISSTAAIASPELTPSAGEPTISYEDMPL